MLRSLWLICVYLSFLGLGTSAPFVITLGYIWVDMFQPQYVAYFVLNQMPVAFIMGAAAIGSYVLLDRRSPPPMTLQSGLQISLAIYMTMTLLWAEVPGPAFEKWDSAFKAMVFAAFIPLTIRSRIQIEAFAQVYAFSMAANFVPFGAKVLLSGGGYGRNLGLLGGNSGLSESGFLATCSLMAVPLLTVMGKHGLLIPRLPLMPLAYTGVSILAIVTALGTHERSAFVGIAVLGVHMFIRSRQKFLFGMAAFVVGLFAAGSALESWSSRGTTISDYSTESSALVRLLVWKWTLGYALTHPLGGSFNSYIVNSVVLPGDQGIQFGRAFHSIYFEVLGELGWPGLIMFLTVLGSTMVSLFQLSRKCRKNPDLAWVADMADAVQTGLLVFLSMGAFLGIAFQPPCWYFVSMGICLRAFVWRAEALDTARLSGWRARGGGASVGGPRLGEGATPGGWRPPAAMPGQAPSREATWRGGR